MPSKSGIFSPTRKVELSAEDASILAAAWHFTDFIQKLQVFLLLPSQISMEEL